MVATKPPPAPSGAATDHGNAASTAEVGAMFDRIAPRYDGMNALISGFQEPRWRRRAIALAELRPGMSAIDVATATGKVALGLADGAHRVKGHQDAKPEDRAESVAQLFAKAGGKMIAYYMTFGEYDFLIVSEGPSPDYEGAFREMRRILRPGGRVVCLEIARPRSIIGRIGGLWFERVVPLLGRLIGEREAYAYLVASVRAYPSPEHIAETMRAAGLVDVRWVALTFGMVTAHIGTRDAD